MPGLPGLDGERVSLRFHIFQNELFRYLIKFSFCLFIVMKSLKAECAVLLQYMDANVTRPN